MINEPEKKQKQTGDDVTRDGFSAEELAEQASYDDETEIARRMRRGDESKGDPDERDVAGTLDPQDTSPDISSDKKRAD
jgi:hypothetical protein